MGRIFVELKKVATVGLAALGLLLASTWARGQLPGVPQPPVAGQPPTGAVPPPLPGAIPPGFPQPATPGAANPAGAANPVAPQAGQIDLQRSRVYARVGAKGLGHPHGIEGRLASGYLLLSSPPPAGGLVGELVIDIGSFVADTPSARGYVGLKGETSAGDQQKVTEHMLAADGLDRARFGTAVFRIRSVTGTKRVNQNDPPGVVLDGEFTMHGVSKPLRVPVTIEPADDRVHVRGQFTVRQSDHGIKPQSKLLGAMGVADEVQVFGDLWVRSR